MNVMIHRSGTIGQILLTSFTSTGTLKIATVTGRCHASGLVYRPMQTADKPKVLQFLCDHYYPHNPICRLLEFNGQKDAVPTINYHFDITLPYLSVVAVDGDQVVGVSLQGQHNLHVKDDTQKKRANIPLETTSEKEKILEMFRSKFIGDYFASKVNIFERYGVDSYLRMRLGTVHSEYGRRGILQEVVRTVENIAKEHGVSCLVTTSTNQYSAKALYNLGFESLAQIPVSEFLYQGKAILRESTEAARLMGKKI